MFFRIETAEHFFGGDEQPPCEGAFNKPYRGNRPCWLVEINTLEELMELVAKAKANGVIIDYTNPADDTDLPPKARGKIHNLLIYNDYLE